MGEVTASRRVRADEQAAYAAHRRQQKREGHRTPRPGATTPMRPPRRHAAPAEGAAFTLAYYRRRRHETGWAADPFSSRAFELVERATTTDEQAQSQALLALDAMPSPRLRREFYEKDSSSYFAARRLAFLAGNVRVLAGRY